MTEPSLAATETRVLQQICADFGVTERWTPARLEGFRTIVAGEIAERPVTESNHTSLADGKVYWQTRAWLCRQGLIEVRYRLGHSYLVLSPVGWRVAYAANFATPPADERKAGR